jgi:hypothetical protein
VPTSIPTQRSTASGANLFTQPQFTQQQLNAIPNQGGLTNDGIIEAFKSMPAPIVTVEDINARSNQVIKVEQRANI